MQLASILGSSGMKLVPDVVLGEGRSNLADVLLARMATGNTTAAVLAELPVRTVPGNGHHATPILVDPDDHGR